MSGMTRADDYAVSVGIDDDSDAPLPPPQIPRLQFARRTGAPVGPPTTAITHMRLDGQVHRLIPTAEVTSLTPFCSISYHLSPPV